MLPDCWQPFLHYMSVEIFCPLLSGFLQQRYLNTKRWCWFKEFSSRPLSLLLCSKEGKQTYTTCTDSNLLPQPSTSFYSNLESCLSCEPEDICHLPVEKNQCSILLDFQFYLEQCCEQTKLCKRLRWYLLLECYCASLLFFHSLWILLPVALWLLIKMSQLIRIKPARSFWRVCEYEEKRKPFENFFTFHFQVG